MLFHMINHKAFNITSTSDNLCIHVFLNFTFILFCQSASVLISIHHLNIFPAYHTNRSLCMYFLPSVPCPSLLLFIPPLYVSLFKLLCLPYPKPALSLVKSKLYTVYDSLSHVSSLTCPHSTAHLPHPTSLTPNRQRRTKVVEVVEAQRNSTHGQHTSRSVLPFGIASRRKLMRRLRPRCHSPYR